MAKSKAALKRKSSKVSQSNSKVIKKVKVTKKKQNESSDEESENAVEEEFKGFSQDESDDEQDLKNGGYDENDAESDSESMDGSEIDGGSESSDNEMSENEDEDEDENESENEDEDESDDNDKRSELNKQLKLNGNGSSAQKSQAKLDVKDSSTEESRKSTQESRAEQKKLREERKISKPHGETIQNIKKIWEKLRVKTGLKASERLKLANEAWSLVKSQAKDLVLKHDASRVIQTILKYSDKAQKEEITKALKGAYYELSKSSYGKYLVVKMLHYGSKETRAAIIDELHGNFRKLMKHREGAYVIEDAYRDYATPAQKRQIIREFYGNEYALFRESASEDKDLSQILADAPHKRPILMKNLNNVIGAAVSKGSIGFQIIHAAMLEYVKMLDPTTSEKTEFIDLITEQFPEIVHTPEGSQVAVRVLSLATAKERKGLVRALKPFISKAALDEYGQFVVTALFNTVDDTVLVSKSFTSDFKDNLKEIMLSKTARKPFLYVLEGRKSRFFSPAVLKQLKEIDEQKQMTSKKDDETRRSELSKAFSPLLLQGLIENTQEILSETSASQFAAEILLYAAAEEDQLQQAIDAVISTIIEHPEIVEEQIYAGRVLRTLIQNGHWNNSSKTVEKGPNDLDFANKLGEKLLKHKEIVQQWAVSEGSFVIVSLLENSKNKIQLTECLGTKILHSDAAKGNKGTELIIKLLN